MTVSPSKASTFIVFDSLENKLSIDESAQTEVEGDNLITITLSAYTNDPVPILRETTYNTMLSVESEEQLTKEDLTLDMGLLPEDMNAQTAAM